MFAFLRCNILNETNMRNNFTILNFFIICFTSPLLSKTIYCLCKEVCERRTGNNVEENTRCLIKVQPQNLSVIFKYHHENFTHYVWFPAEIPTKNIPNESLQSFCYTDLLGTGVRQKIMLLFCVFLPWFNIYKQEEVWLLWDTNPVFWYTNHDDHRL